MYNLPSRVILAHRLLSFVNVSIFKKWMLFASPSLQTGGPLCYQLVCGLSSKGMESHTEKQKVDGKFFDRILVIRQNRNTKSYQIHLNPSSCTHTTASVRKLQGCWREQGLVEGWAARSQLERVHPFTLRFSKIPEIFFTLWRFF